MSYSIGIDYGTASGRVFLINTTNGQVVSKFVKPYTHGVIEGELNGLKIPHTYALQNSNDYLEIMEEGISYIVRESKIDPVNIVGIGIDFTSSTIIFTDENLNPVHNLKQFKNNPHAYVKLWKHHGAYKEAEKLYQTAIENNNKWLGHYGYNVSSEWMIPKIMEVMNRAPEIMEKTAYIMEAGDWIVNKLTNKNVRSNCGLGFKAFWEEETGFHYDLFDKVDPKLSKVIQDKVSAPVVNIGEAVGDLFEYVAKQAPKSYVDEAANRNMTVFELMNEKIKHQMPGESGLIALDWHNGNRSVLSDSNLTGCIFGLTLQTKHEDIYRAYLEATAFGTKMIMQQYQDWHMEVEKVFACGGIPKKNAVMMDIYTNVLNKKLIVMDSEYAPAIGAAILGAVSGGAHNSINDAVDAMKEPILYEINPEAEKVQRYETLFKAYKALHDIHGYKKANIMKDIQSLRVEG